MTSDLDDPRLTGVYAKINRAKTHGFQLHKEVRSFFHANNGRFVTEMHGNNVVKFSFSFTQPVPVRFGLIIGDVVHNLRTALDHVACAAAALNGHGPENIYFPFYREVEFFDRDATNHLRLMPDKFAEIVKAAKPYKGGNSALYALHQLDIVDKHRILLPAVAVATKSRAQFVVGEPGQPNYREVGPPVFEITQDVFPGREPNNTVVEAMVVKGPLLPAEAYLHFQPTLQIRFDEGTIAAGKEIFASLSEMVNQVQGIVRSAKSAVFQ